MDNPYESPHDPPASPSEHPPLERGIGLVQATSLNVANMVGVGPFITIPLFVASMGGPQALIGWIVAAVLVLCDGLVWSELGAALPGSGGTYHFLREIYGRYPLGRLIAFLVHLAIPDQRHARTGQRLHRRERLPGATPCPSWRARLADWGIPGGLSVCAAAAALVVSVVAVPARSLAGLAGRRACAPARCVTTCEVIVAGLSNFDASLLTFPPDAFRLDRTFFTGLGAAMLIADLRLPRLLQRLPHGRRGRAAGEEHSAGRHLLGADRGGAST